MTDVIPGGDPQTEIEGLNEWAFGGDGDLIETWVYRLDDSGQRSGRGDGRPAYFRKLTGDIDPEILRRECGGGDFELKVHVNRKIRKTVKVSVIGPRLTDEDISRATRVDDVPKPVAEPVATAAPQLDANALAATLTASITAAFSPLLERLAAPREAPRQEMTFENVLQLAERLRGPSHDPSALVGAQIEMLKRGIEIANRGSGEGRSLGDAIVESMPHVVETVDKMLAARATQMHSGAPATRAPGAAPAANPQTLQNVLIAGQVAKAIENHVDPADFADVLETMYGEETRTLVTLGPGVVVGVLRPFAAQFPVLGTPQLEQYVAAVMDELKRDPEQPGDAESGDATSGA